MTGMVRMTGMTVKMTSMTEFLVIGSRQQLLKIHHCSVRVGTIDTKPVKVARNLGTWFDSHFSMLTHISMSCSAAFFWLHNTRE